MKYEYTFSVWPDEESPRWRGKVAVFHLFNMLKQRITFEFTESQFREFRNELAMCGFTFREIERVPAHPPEPIL